MNPHIPIEEVAKRLAIKFVGNHGMHSVIIRDGCLVVRGSKEMNALGLELIKLCSEGWPIVYEQDAVSARLVEK